MPVTGLNQRARVSLTVVVARANSPFRKRKVEELGGMTIPCYEFLSFRIEDKGSGSKIWRRGLGEL